MRAMLKARSLRTILIGLFVPLMVINGGMIGVLAFRSGQTAVTDLAHQLQSETTARIQDHLRDYLSWPHQLNQINLDSIALGQIEPDDFTALEPYFWTQVQRFNLGSVAYASAGGAFLNLGREDPQGPIVVAVTDTAIPSSVHVYATDSQGRRTQRTQTYAAYDPRSRPWYQQAVRANQPNWTPIFVWTNGAIGIDAVVPVHDEARRLRGVLDVSLTLEDISRFLQSLTVGATGMTYIIDRDGMIVASSASEPPFSNDRTARRFVLDSRVPMIQGSAQALIRNHGGFAAIQGEQRITFDLEAGPALAHATPYRDQYGLDWLIVVVVPEADFMGQITANTRTTSALAVLALLITSGIAAGIAAWMTQPIRALHQAATAFAASHWDQAVPQGGGREVSELAAAFESMAAQLRATFASLQTKEQRLREALEAAQMGTWEWNIPQHRMTWSAQVAPLYGLPPGEQNGPPEAFFARIHPDDHQLLNDQIMACLARQRTSSRWNTARAGPMGVCTGLRQPGGSGTTPISSRCACVAP